MPRKNKYDEYVKPKIDEIRKWVIDLNERQIAAKLGITQQTLEKYKREHPELKEVLIKGRQDLVFELKDSLRKKARGFYYTETKTYIRDEDGKKIKTIEKFEKYSPPDTGAIHLLLKNLDDEWHNDDAISIEFKKLQQQLDKERIEMQKW
jgi:hypothetical protein